MAVEEVNRGPLARMGHKLDFIVAETYGEEVTSVQKTADLWTKNISVYIGPQETCEHEAFMAAAFNLPMISYVSEECYVRLERFENEKIHTYECIMVHDLLQIGQNSYKRKHCEYVFENTNLVDKMAPEISF